MNPVPDFQQDVTVYLVVNDFGQLGKAYVETDIAEADREAIIRNFISGQHSNAAGHGIRRPPVALGRPSAPADRARDLADAGLTVLGRPSTLGCPRPAGRILGLPWPACRYLLAEPMAISASVSRRRSRCGPQSIRPNHHARAILLPGSRHRG